MTFNALAYVLPFHFEMDLMFLCSLHFIDILLFHESVLLVYAEAMARSMASDRRYNYAQHDVHRRRNFFIDDECESS